MPVPVHQITAERLKDWGEGCAKAHATPALLVAIGHDHARGELHFFMPDDPLLDRAALRALLAAAIRRLG